MRYGATCTATTMPIAPSQHQPADVQRPRAADEEHQQRQRAEDHRRAEIRLAA